MHPFDWPVSRNLAHRLIATQFPALANLPLRGIGQSGTDNVLYRLGPTLVVRFPRLAWSASQTTLQARLLPALHPQLPLLSPLTRHLGEPDLGYPYPWSVLDWLPGRSAAEALDQMRSAEDLARFLSALHKAPQAHDAPVNLDDLAQRFQSLDPYIAQFQDEVDPLLLHRAKQELAPPPARNHRIWQHGDLHALNMLTRRGRVTSVLDWGCMGIGDPGIDLMAAWTLFDAPARRTFHDLIKPHPVDWARGRALAFAKAVAGIPYYRQSNPIFAAMMRRTLHRVLEGL